MEADTLTASNSAAFYNIELVITSPLRRLVEENFENSLKTLDFCAALEQGLRRARDSHLLILVALQQFEDESLVQDAESPFNEDFFKMFQSVYSQQEVMLEKLRLRENELDKKLECIHTWRKLSSIIFVGTFATVLIGSFVATAMAAPHVAAAFGAATAPLDSMGKWIDSLWKNCENELKGEKEVISSMQAGTFVAVKDLDNIRVLIERLEIEIKGMVKSAEFAVEHDPVKIGIDDIKKKVDVFKKNVEELGVQADWCSRDIRRARTDYSEDHQASSSST